MQFPAGCRPWSLTRTVHLDGLLLVSLPAAEGLLWLWPSGGGLGCILEWVYPFLDSLSFLSLSVYICCQVWGTLTVTFLNTAPVPPSFSPPSGPDDVDVGPVAVAPRV